MSFESPSEQTNTSESAEKPTYRIAELEEQIVNLDKIRNQAREAMKRNEITMDVYGGKLGEIDKDESSAKAELQKEKDRISPEDRELLEIFEQEKGSLTLEATGFDNLLKRYRSMQDFEGKPRPDVNTEEYRQLVRELSQAQTDFRNKRFDLEKRMNDAAKRGLISGQEIAKVPNI